MPAGAPDGDGVAVELLGRWTRPAPPGFRATTQEMPNSAKSTAESLVCPCSSIKARPGDAESLALGMQIHAIGPEVAIAPKPPRALVVEYGRCQLATCEA
ncbi:hypothetical protein TW95_gp0856 [Pandoravirus inopinatum]|uniref:Uncharacterized protein n=1 Tax=Pandoravirus inopinatum TaxID=1605721 RepID=A0A0B5J702_9VIRU|nr:hypothetical protein TW95_gp0856 [Pandoravirus inopinatum]AJF97590.1 hypothetical protein [Pandoravirus inopinatum]